MKRSRSIRAIDVERLAYHLSIGDDTSTRPALVLVHGRSGDASLYLRAFQPLTDQQGVTLVVPQFLGPAFHGYQRLVSASGPLGAAKALDAALDDVSSRLGRSLGRVDLVGFSGGAQFVHRFAMFFPHRVRRVVAAAAGWYTQIDEYRTFPSGIAPHDRREERHIDVSAFLRIPLRLMVGENDVERDRGLRTGAAIDAVQGRHRLARALRWLEHLASEARSRQIEPRASFELLPGTGHSFHQAMAKGDFGGRVARFLAAHDVERPQTFRQG